MIAATILSAGISARMGHPKALLEYRGRTFLESILDATSALGIKRRLVVLGPSSDKILQMHDLRNVTVLTTEAFDAGPIGSIRASIREIRAHPVDGLLVWPVDMPHVTIETVELLMDTFRSSGRPIVVPAYGGRRGHPVIFGRDVLDELMTVPDNLGAKAVVRADPGRVEVLEVQDWAVVDDLNTPSAYQDLIKKDDLRREQR